MKGSLSLCLVRSGTVYILKRGRGDQSLRAVVKDSFVEVWKRRVWTDLFVFINLEDVAERDGHLDEHRVP